MVAALRDRPGQRHCSEEGETGASQWQYLAYQHQYSRGSKVERRSPLWLPFSSAQTTLHPLNAWFGFGQMSPWKSSGVGTAAQTMSFLSCCSRALTVVLSQGGTSPEQGHSFQSSKCAL